MELSPMHLLLIFVIIILIFVGVPWLAYRHGRKVGEQAGYIRGYKEGQSARNA